ncbi:RHOMBOID-like protein 8 [Mangifera indica]|uniref:RHOMBOID-like protein 8 n=1 Tax=Mangifera indica TaxID=29780 RepID=UPI001CFA0F58|nr:RHOMBOID-like protein 8 [Mangifera indica]
MGDTSAAKFQSHLEIKKPQPPSPPLRRFSLSENQDQGHQKTPFFKSRAGTRKNDTLIISIFVILHVVVFIATMVANDCRRNSHGDCTVKALGRLSFQPLSENPLLGPSASALDEMGALRQNFLQANHHSWRLFTCTGLHAGLIHLIINLGSVIFVGIHFEQVFGPLRTGIIYVLSAFVGTLVAALFIRNSPAVNSSGALFGLLGAMLSELIRDWNVYTDKLAAISFLSIVSTINFVVGLLPYANNFSSIGGLISGFLLGFILLFTPDDKPLVHNKAGLYEYNTKTYIKSKLKLDRPIMGVWLILFVVLLLGSLAAVLTGMNMNQYCNWCKYVDCIPSKRWSCNDVTADCETMVSNSQMTLTCMGNGNFRVFPYTNISQARLRDLCTLLC